MLDENLTYEELEMEIKRLKEENEQLRSLTHKNTDFERLKSLVSNLQMGILIESGDRKIIDANPTFCKLFDIPSPAVIQGKPCDRAAEQASQLFRKPQEFVENISKILARNQVVLNEELRLKDGRVFERDYIPVSKESQFIGNLWVYRDITERKNAEEELKKSEAKFRLLSENSSDGITLMESDKITYVSEGYKRLLGYKKEELENIGVNDIYSFIHPDDADKIKNALQNAHSRQHKYLRYQLRLKTKKGNYIWVEDNIYFEYDVAGNHARSIIHTRDINKQKQAEEKLKESEERFRKLIKNMDEGVVLYNPEGLIIEFNKKAKQIITLEGKKLKSQNPEKYIARMIYENGKDFPQDNYPVTRTLKEEIEVKDIIIGLVKISGKTTWIKVSSSPVYLSINNKPYALVTFSDITKLKEKEQSLTELNATKDKIFSIIGHDLRNPFNAILSLSEMIMNNTRDKDYSLLEKQSSLLLQSAKQGVALLNNLLHWSRVQTGRMEYNPETIKLQDMVKRIQELSQVNLKEKELTFRSKISPDTTIKADKFMIELIIRNLISNAIKYTPKGGNINVKVSQNKKETKISVHDTGIGIEKGSINKLFNIESNYKTPGTNNEKGTGIGLILCREFVDYHGGTIKVSSQENKGSTFTVILPHMLQKY